jgi:chemotaxis protein methyltransferase CheR
VNRITLEEIALLSRHIQSLSGISLDASKAYLFEARLAGLATDHGCSTYSDLYLRARSDKALERKMVDAMTTNETSFFRDAAPFELLRNKILPDIVDRRSKRAGKGPIPLRIWSAACSYGQEVYSIATILRELLPDPKKYQPWVLGTDICDAAIARSSRGYYEKLEIERGLPRPTLEKHFVPSGEGWKIKEEIRALVAFRRLNLMEDFSSLGRFDVVFCRNVAIYFDERDRARLFERIAKVLEPDGALVIGATESLLGICPLFESRRYLRSVFYERASAAPAGAAPIAAPFVRPALVAAAR